MRGTAQTHTVEPAARPDTSNLSRFVRRKPVGGSVLATTPVDVLHVVRTLPYGACMEEPPRRTAHTDYVVVDVETTGLCPIHNALTEIGAIRFSAVDNWAGDNAWVTQARTFATLIRPPHPIPAIATKLTGITDHMVVAAPHPDDALRNFWEFAADATLVAHNAVFDAGFLHAHTAAASLPWHDAPWVDTLWWARQAWPRPTVSNHRLGTLATHINAPTTPNHRALADAWTTAHLLRALRHATGRTPLGGGYCPPPSTSPNTITR